MKLDYGRKNDDENKKNTHKIVNHNLPTELYSKQNTLKMKICREKTAVFKAEKKKIHRYMCVIWFEESESKTREIKKRIWCESHEKHELKRENEIATITKFSN